MRLGIGHESRVPSQEIDWTEIKALADAHGLSAIVLDGLNTVQGEGLMVHGSMPQMMRLEWIGEVFQNYEQLYKQYEKAISSLAGFYNQHGYKMMVLKGYACSLDWPKLEHRPCGDIDIWLFGQQKEADVLLESSEFRDESLESVGKVKRIKVDNSHHHHTVFEWDGFSVENHYDFINVHHHKSNAQFEKILKQLGEDDSHTVEVDGDKVYLPSPNLHALFLLKHLMMHFASEGIMLRQVVDWGFFVEKHGKDVEWKYVMDVLDQFGMRKMFNIINAICVGDLGFDARIFPEVQFDPHLKDRVSKEILDPEYSNHTPTGFIKRVIFKIRRWIGNAWKHKLCYKETMWSAFWSGVWNHLLKPSSI